MRSHLNRSPVLAIEPWPNFWLPALCPNLVSGQTAQRFLRLQTAANSHQWLPESPALCNETESSPTHTPFFLWLPLCRDWMNPQPPVRLCLSSCSLGILLFIPYLSHAGSRAGHPTPSAVSHPSEKYCRKSSILPIILKSPSVVFTVGGNFFKSHDFFFCQLLIWKEGQNLCEYIHCWKFYCWCMFKLS